MAGLVLSMQQRDELIPNYMKFLPRPATPQLSSFTEYSITIKFISPPKVYNISKVSSYYRLINDTWLAGASLLVSQNGFIPTIIVDNLVSDSWYEICIQYISYAGHSLRSLPISVKTQMNITAAIFPANIIFQNSSHYWIDLNTSISTIPDNLSSSDKFVYQLQYTTASTEWITYPTNFHFFPHTYGMAIQEFSIFLDSTSLDVYNHPGCTGYFWVKLKFSDQINPSSYLSPVPLPWDASETMFFKAIRAIPVINKCMSEGRLIVSIYRSRNFFNGFTWRIELSGSALSLAPQYSYFPFDIYRHTLTSIRLIGDNQTGVVSVTGPCWSSNPSQPIYIKVVKYPLDIFSNDTRSVRVDGLIPDTVYSFRIQLLNQAGKPYLWSNNYQQSTLPLKSSFINDTSFVSSSWTFLDHSNAFDISNFISVEASTILSLLSIWDTGVTIVWTVNKFNAWDIEIANSSYSDDFRLLLHINSSPNGSSTLSYDISSLAPSSNYRIRIIPVSLVDGRNLPSNPISFTTYSTPVNYWIRIMTRRFSTSLIGGGFGYPVIDRPYDQSDTLSTFSQKLHGTTNPSLYASLSFPTGRLGHSLSIASNSMIMFGGRTNGM